MLLRATLRSGSVYRWEKNVAYTVGFMLVPHTGNEWVLSGPLGGVKNINRTRPGNNDLDVGKTNPLIRIVRKKQVTLSPVFGFFFASRGESGWLCRGAAP